ncbi:MAG: hypothetical protein QOD07_1768 [Frankiaceae bacterium]|nr:hypothetical protein [Frankiaceae bacterium]
MYRFRPALAVTAVLAVVTAAAAPALASASSAPAHGAASSGLRLLHVELGGHAISAGEIAAQASNAMSPHVAQIVVTPAALDGTTYGQQTVTPASSPVTVPSGAQTATIPGGLASLTGPTFSVTAKDGTTVLTSAVLKALGSLSVGPLPVSLDATAASLTNTAEVTASQASAEKSVVLGNLALPSVAGLLSALNIDLGTLTSLLTQANLGQLAQLVGGTVTSLSAAVTSAANTVAALPGNVPVPSTLTAAQAAQATDDAAKSAADSAYTTSDPTFTTLLNTALATAVLPLGTPSLVGTSPQQFLALSTTLTSILDAAAHAGTPGSSSTPLSDQANADAAAKTAADALASAIDTLTAAIQALVTAVQNAVNASNDPLASLGSISVTTKAVASANSPAPVAEAKIGTLNILGAITPPAALTSTLNGVLAQLSGVLNSVAGISFTPPSVAVGVGHTSRSVSGTAHLATASITGVTITLPKLTLPTSFLNLAARSAKGASPRATVPTTVVTNGGTVEVGTLSESASYTPAVTGSAGAPGSGSKTPNLAGTGMSYSLPVAAALVVMSGLALLRRRRAATADVEA